MRRASLYWADGVTLLAIAAAIAVGYALDAADFGVATRSGLGVLLAFVPAVAWWTVFNRRDRAQAEPLRLVGAVAALAAILAAGLGEPLLRLVDLGAERSVVANLAVGILVVGVVRQTLVYAAIRFSVFDSVEFDEPVDGVVYGTAAGLGYATTLSIAAIVQAEGALLGPSMLRVAVTALAFAGLGGLTGSGLAAWKFHGQPVWTPAVAVLTAAVLNGIFFVTRAEALSGVGSATFGRWGSLAVAAAMAAAITVVLLRLHQSRERAT